MTIFTSPALAACRRFVIRDAYDCQVLVDEEGVLYTPEGAYATIGEVTQGEWPEEQRLFRATRLAVAEYDDGSDWEVAMSDAWGNPVTDGREEKRRFYADSLGMPSELPDFAESGLLDADGNVAIEPRFAVVRSNGEGGYLATVPLDDNYGKNAYDMELGKGFQLIHFDASGNRTDTGLTIYDLGEFSDGLAQVCVRVGETAIFEDDFREGYVDARGKLAIEPRFREAGELLRESPR